MIEENIELNSHNKEEYPPMHTAEHILNQTMVRMFGCERSVNAHIERKKSKCDYTLDAAPTDAQVTEIERRVNEVVASGMDVFEEYISYEEAEGLVDTRKLPEDVSRTLRIVRVGDYDVCACIGRHVENTREIGVFRIVSHNYASDGRWRVRFKLVDSPYTDKNVSSNKTPEPH